MAVEFKNGVSFLKGIDLEVNYPDGSKEDMKLDAPNGSNPVIFREVYTGSPKFRDARNRLRKGSRLSRVMVVLNYSSNLIEKNKLLVSDSVKMKFNGINTPFLNENFRFEDRSVKKHWMSSTPITSSGDTIEDMNPIPGGDCSLSFMSTDFYVASAPWILAEGAWDDDGIWLDNEFWNDN